jgi:hypothetical protein
MNLPPIQSNVLSSAIAVGLGVTCFVFAIIEILIDILFPPVRRDHRQRGRRRRSLLFSESSRVNSMSPMVPPPVLAELEIDGFELEGYGMDRRPDDVV